MLMPRASTSSWWHATLASAAHHGKKRILTGPPLLLGLLATHVQFPHFTQNQVKLHAEADCLPCSLLPQVSRVPLLAAAAIRRAVHGGNVVGSPRPLHSLTPHKCDTSALYPHNPPHICTLFPPHKQPHFLTTPPTPHSPHPSSRGRQRQLVPVQGFPQWCVSAGAACVQWGVPVIVVGCSGCTPHPHVQCWLEPCACTGHKLPKHTHLLLLLLPLMGGCAS